MNKPIHFDNLPTHEIAFSEVPEGIEIVMSDPRQSVYTRGRLNWDQLNQFTEWLAEIGSDNSNAPVNL
jgi:hypothetical protein